MRKSLMVILACAVAGCTHTREAQQGANEEPTFEEQIVKYEVSFRPSDYDPLPSGKNGATAPGTDSGASTVLPPVNAEPEYVAGFRVQVYSSASIDDARERKSEIEALHPTEWIYLEYDPPAYKVRAGNFLNRFEADRFAKVLIEEGYADAWTVPARVVKNPPPPNR
jgi:hypothetical protein